MADDVLKTRHYILPLLALLWGWTACESPANNQQAESQISATVLKKHIAILANDSLLGRKPFTLGETKTIRYIREQFRQLGLEPANGGRYYQDVPLVEINSQVTKGLEISGSGTPLQLQYEKDFVALSEQEVPEIRLKAAPLVFAGFGVVAPEYHWNDYAGLDVKGKVVIVLVNDPGFHSGQPDFFKGDTMTYYGRWTYKYEEAARQGAAGVLIVHQTAPASYPWGVVQSSFSGAQLYLQDPQKHLDRCKMEGWITYETAQKLLERGGISGDFTTLARKQGFKAVPLHQKLTVHINNQIRYNKSHNVAGLLKGSTRPDEYIIYSAHWDHFGIGRPVAGDSIYNGAIDNASGVASMLAIAQAFTRLPSPPKRSLLFLAVTSEEQGLLGSAYYAAHPLFPLNKTVADINLDAMGSYGATQDIVVTGLGQNHLEDEVQALAKRDSLTVRGDLNPSSGGYFRSDHFSFAKVGVPAIDVHNGLKSLSHDSAWTRAQRARGGQTYHQPSDEYDSTADYTGMVQVSRLLYELGYRLSSENSFPGWKTGSEFRALREKMRSSP